MHRLQRCQSPVGTGLSYQVVRERLGYAAFWQDRAAFLYSARRRAAMMGSISAVQAGCRAHHGAHTGLLCRVVEALRSACKCHVAAGHVRSCTL